MNQAYEKYEEISAQAEKLKTELSKTYKDELGPELTMRIENGIDRIIAEFKNEHPTSKEFKEKDLYHFLIELTVATLGEIYSTK